MKNLEKYSDRIEKQHLKNKLFYLERLNLLFDNGDYSSLVSENDEDGCIVCVGKINEKDVVVACQDFTTQGGSLSLKQGRNIVLAQNYALSHLIPIIYFNDSGGARIQDGIESLCGYGELFYNNVKLSGIVPQISIIAGPCAGGAVYSPGITDFIFMIEDVSQMYITGPKVIKSVTGETISPEELGGYRVHTEESGVCNASFENEELCIEAVKKLLALLPSNFNSYNWYGESPIKTKLPSFEMPENSKRVYDIRNLIKDLFDDDSFFEISRNFGKSIITAFATLNSNTIGIIANQPNYYAGVLDCDTSDKAARFVRFCDCFNIPLVTFTDTPGYLPGSDQEAKGIIRHGAKLIYAFSEASTIKINIILRKAYGGAYIAMNSKHLGADYVYALQTAECAVMGAQGAVEIIYAKQIKQLEESEKEEFISKKELEYQQEIIGYKEGLKKGYIDELVDLDQLRLSIYKKINEIALSKKSVLLCKKHGNIPL